MESKKNTAPKGVLILVGLIVLMMVIYFILVMFFPEFLDKLNLGDVKPFK